MAKSLVDKDGRFIPLIDPLIVEAGYKLVRVMMTSSPSEGQIVQIMIEPDTKETLNLDDCAALSRAIGTLFEVEDPISGAYRLEVSSPGVDRPLTRLEDFEKYSGQEAKIELETPLVTGQKRFQGVIKGIQGSEIIFDAEEDQIRFPFSELVKASLRFSEEKLKESLKKAKANANK